MARSLLMATALLAVVAAPAPATSLLQPADLVGTWQLVSSTRKVLATGQENDTYGPHPVGFITYGRDGRMMVLIVGGPRPHPASIDKMTDADRAQLFKTMLGYAGTYTLTDGTIPHSIDASWYEIWTGTKTVRDVRLEGIGSSTPRSQPRRRWTARSAW